MISEKDKKIVIAVNRLQAAPSGCGPDKLSVATEWNQLHKTGDIRFTSASVDNPCWDTFCSLDDYYQCIREMSAGKFVTPCELTEGQAKRLYANIDEQSGLHKKPEFEYGQKVYVDATGCEGKDVVFGCMSLCGELCILLLEGGHMTSPIKSVSATPFKSSEEIEMEEAKKKQVDDILLGLHETKMMKFNKPFTRKMLEAMQEKGYLAEVLLPLESK